MTKPINIKVVCACGEEVSEKLSLRDEIKTRIMYALTDSLLDEEFDRAAESILALFEEDRPAEPKRFPHACGKECNCHEGLLHIHESAV